MNKEQQQIIDEVYENFIKSYTGKDNEIILPPFDYINDDGNLMSKNQFITNIKYNYWFSETWGVKIEERELNDDELNIFNLLKQTFSKLITITYNNKTIESYEY